MKPQHQTFILGMIKHGDKIQAYRAAYPNCNNDETARKSAERLLHHHPAIAAEIAESTAHIRQQAYTEAYQQHIAQQKTPLLSMMKRREILAQIATCEMKVARFVKDGDRYKMLFEDPRPRDIMKAIELDAKLEDACNRLRNFSDPVLSQFNIYIDGRPCDQPHLPPDPNLPPGIYMLPRRRKNQIENSGINRGSSSMPQIENQNSGIISEQTNLSPVACPDHFGSGGVRFVDGGGILAPEQSLIEEPGITPETNMMPQIENQNPGIKMEQNKKSDSFPACPDSFGVLREGGTSEASDGRVDDGSTSAEAHPDPLAASFYKQDQQARESAPPLHILTPEEVKAMDDEYAQRHEGKSPKPSTFGKMYFKEKGIDHNNIE